jgi:hypothetical protein
MRDTGASVDPLGSLLTDVELYGSIWHFEVIENNLEP